MGPASSPNPPLDHPTRKRSRDFVSELRRRRVFADDAVDVVVDVVVDVDVDVDVVVDVVVVVDETADRVGPALEASPAPSRPS